MVEGGADHLGAAGHLRVGRRIELDLPRVPFRADDAVAGLDAFALAGENGQFWTSTRVEPIGTAHDLRDAHRMAADAVDEPARIGQLVDRVDVDRRACRGDRPA